MLTVEALRSFRAVQINYYLANVGASDISRSELSHVIDVLLHMSSDLFEELGRQNWVRGRKPIFRKIHFGVRSVKSTH